MGAIFALEHANIISYITSKSTNLPPAFLRINLLDFLEAFAHNEDLIDGNKTLLSSEEYSEWPKKISEIANRAFNDLNESELDVDQSPFLAPKRSESILSEMKGEFSSFETYFLYLSADYTANRSSLPDVLARRKGSGQSLTLIPTLRSQWQRQEEQTEMFDPFPAISIGLHAFDQWPGFLCWSHSGKAAFIKAENIDEFIEELDRGAGNDFSRHVDHVLEKWSSLVSLPKKRLLHLSDLHFGTGDAILKKKMLLAELRDVVNEVDRIVITGDLFDSPDEPSVVMFTEFCETLTEISGGKVPIYIPGNHDIKIKGILGKTYEQIAKITPTTVEIDDEAKMVFIGFNTSEDGILARGSISKAQLTRIGSEYKDLLAKNSRAKEYLPIILLHHHPFSYENEPVGSLEKAFRYFGVSIESTLKMKDPEDFYEWCADWNFNTVLHGHKHSAKHIRRNVRSSDEPFDLTAIGCGSSLGAEGTPISYNLLEWDPVSNNWIVSFHQSKNGGEFKEKAVALSF